MKTNVREIIRRVITLAAATNGLHTNARCLFLKLNFGVVLGEALGSLLAFSNFRARPQMKVVVHVYYLFCNQLHDVVVSLVAGNA